MLRQMNDAMARHQQVNLKAWRIGRNANDPHRGELRSYRGWYVTSHTPSGRYRLDDPLSNDPTQRRRMVCEAMISEFMGKRVIW